MRLPNGARRTRSTKKSCGTVWEFEYSRQYQYRRRRDFGTDNARLETKLFVKPVQQMRARFRN